MRGVSVIKEQSSSAKFNNADLLMVQAIETLQETNHYLKSISSTAELSLSFFRKVVPWGIAAAAVLWPSIGKLIDHLPPFSH